MEYYTVIKSKNLPSCLHGPSGIFPSTPVGDWQVPKMRKEGALV